MSIKIGTSDVTDIKIGTTNVNTVYIGSTVIWQRGGDVYTYEIHTTVEYSSGGTINAAGSNYATIKTYWRTYINSVLDSEVLTDMSVSITYNPETDHFSVTRTGVGTYKVEADSRGTDAGDSWSCTVGISYSGENTSESVYQEANAVIDTGYDTVIEISISSNYDSVETPASAGGASWSVTASGREVNYEREQYTSLSWTSWVEVTDSLIMPSAITLSASGDGFSGSGNGGGTTVTWASRGTVVGSLREGVITPTYNSETYATKYVYQEANALEYTDNHVITSLTLNGVNDNITIDADATYVYLTGGGTNTEHYTSLSTKGGSFSIPATGFSVSGTGFTYNQTYQRVEVAENEGAERTGTVTAAYTGATSVQRTITQEAAVVVVIPTVTTANPAIGSDPYTMYGQMTDDGNGTISAYGFKWGYASNTMNQTANSSNMDGSGNFSAQISELIAGATLYFKAFATNEEGIGYGTTKNVTIPI